MTFSEAGVLSGTPTEGGRFGFQVRVTDQRNRQDIQSIALFVEPVAFCDREENGNDPICSAEDDGGCTSVRTQRGALDAGSTALLGMVLFGWVALRPPPPQRLR
ncbi:MAG: hypothetical protein HC923_06905 [Myxococcales bacterium]|nr:hypothetical protein [Myxococcales bacterium]